MKKQSKSARSASEVGLYARLNLEYLIIGVAVELFLPYIAFLKICICP